jgi:hypothetical protein
MMLDAALKRRSSTIDLTRAALDWVDEGVRPSTIC